MTRRGLLLPLSIAMLALGAAAWAGAAGVLGQDGPLPGDGSVHADGRALMYPAQQIHLRMDHAHPAHRDLPCVRCHDRAEASTRSGELLVPTERACLPCHAADARTQTRETPPGARCETCHERAGTAIVASSFPRPRIAFSHAAHVARGMRCESCHAHVKEHALATTADLPSMRDCLRCHGGAQASAQRACRTCHEVEPDGVLRARLPEGTLTPPAWMSGMQHDADWLVRHRWVAADQGSACAGCHRERECADCHDGRVRPRSVHPGDYLTTHVTAARRDATRCTSCHEPQRFCAECHARLGLATVSAPIVRGGGRYHPPEAAWRHAHGVEARRSMTSCITCHAERDCVACHGAVGVGGGVSPHPPGFVNGCAALIRQNPRACVTCHADLSAVSARCR